MRVLILGSTGLVGAAVAARLDTVPDVDVARASRQPDAQVRIDLDDPRTFPAALSGVDGIFVATGYTVAMTHQTKTLTDAAADAGVRHIVHLGIFGDGRQTDPHFAWHELVERYIEHSGVPWTHLHPHTFMENLLTTFPLRQGRLTWPLGDKPTGWVAVDDIAAVAAKVLADGPDVHAGKQYWLATEVLDGPGMAQALSRGLGQPIGVDVLTPDQIRDVATMPAFMEANYASAAFEWLQQTYDGRMDFAGVTTTTVRDLLGQPPLSVADWAARHRDELMAANR
jgi:uncharacterized protein YbjT (DUF2867 family)